MIDWFIEWAAKNSALIFSSTSGGAIHVLFVRVPPRESIRRFLLATLTAYKLGPLAVDVTEHYTWLSSAEAKSAVICITGICSMQLIEFGVTKFVGVFGHFIGKFFKMGESKT
jgi:hypothetical protein